MIETIGHGWAEALGHWLGEADRARLEDFLAGAWKPGGPTVYPRADQVFAAFTMAPAEVRAVILGQDPYANPDQACGLAFAVPAGVDRPLSLQRIIAKVEEDLGSPVPAEATLDRWASQGILLLNSALTVEAKKPGAHGRVWWPFTKAVLQVLADQSPIVFLLWGNDAQDLGCTIDRKRYVVRESAHPAARLRRDDPRRFQLKHPFRETRDLVDWSLC